MPPPAVPPIPDAGFTTGALGIALAQTLEDSGRSGYAVGVSGDSNGALAAWIATRAVGADRVMVIEPDAAGLPEGNDRSQRNFAARLRMARLYEAAERRDLLVLGTADKSQIVLGGLTLWGETAADVHPLGDLYHTQVRALARSAGPAETAEVDASDPLVPEVGFSYSAADPVLYYYLDERLRPGEIEARGVAAETVTQVLDRLRAQAYKRRTPHVVKLSARTVGHDFHHPRAWLGPA